MQESKNVTVSIVTQFFHPDTSANAGNLTDLATGLADQGVNVRVVTMQPSYTVEDRDTLADKKETYQGVSIRRLPATRFDRNAGIAWRMINETTFFISAFIYFLIIKTQQKNVDVLILPTSPTFLPILGWLLSPIYGDRYVPIVYDLYPDMAVSLGYLTQDGPVYWIWNQINRLAFSKAIRIVTIGETIQETIVSKYTDECDVTIIHNWADKDRIQPQSKVKNPFAIEHGFLDELTVLYSGNLGRHHDLESVIDAAAQLETFDFDLSPHFVLIGEGGKKQPLQEMVVQQNLKSVTFLPYQPIEVLPDSLTSGDIAVVTMKEEVEGLCVSSKFYTALASGQAILAISSPDTEIGRVVEQTECGIRVDPNSPDQIVDAIRFWIKNQDVVAEMGAKSRTIFENEFTKESSVTAYNEMLEDITHD